eukprot:4689548-Pyramimonas_sp.AAC.1
MLLPRISRHCNLIPYSSSSASTAERVSHATELRQPRSILPDFQDMRLTSASSPLRIFRGASPATRPFVDFPSGRLASEESDHSTGTNTCD